jgi:hypothetical protein
MIAIKFLLNKFKVEEKVISTFFLILGGISFFIFLILIATTFGRESIYDRLSTYFFNSYLITTITASILLFISSFLAIKFKFYSYIIGFIGCIFFTPILYEIFEDVLIHFNYGYTNEINWGSVLPEIILFIFAFSIAFLNLANLILAFYQKYKEKAKPDK